MYCNASININYEGHQVGKLEALSTVAAPAKDGLKFEIKEFE